MLLVHVRAGGQARLPGFWEESMSQSLRTGFTKLALTAAVVVLGTGGAVASVAAASPDRPAAAPPVDHQLCYRTGVSGTVIPPTVILKNQFSPGGFRPTIARGGELCNPVQKTLPGGQTFHITNPRAHLVCYKITEPRQPTPTVVVSNQFGGARLVPRQPNLLCLPSWKSLVGVPRERAIQPPGLSHFTCYPVRVASGSYHPPTVRLKDEFTNQPVTAHVNPVPVELCLPTEKIVGAHDFPIVNPVTHLLCFPVSPTPVRNAWYKNQFGRGSLAIHQTNALCVPSTKRVVAP
jgi:hypothetical protein